MCRQYELQLTKKNIRCVDYVTMDIEVKVKNGFTKRYCLEEEEIFRGPAGNLCPNLVNFSIVPTYFMVSRAFVTDFTTVTPIKRN